MVSFKYFAFFILFSFVIRSQLSGQSRIDLIQYSDSIYTEIKTIEDVDKKAEELFNLSFFWSDYDEQRALEYIFEAKEVLANKSETNYYRGLDAFYRAAIFFDKDREKAKGLYMDAEAFLRNAELDHAHGALTHRARLWGNYGALLQRDGRSDKYVDILLHKVIPFAEKSGDSTLMGNNYQNVALNLMNMQEYEKANQYYRKAINLLRDANDAKEERLTLYVNAARNSLFAKSYEGSKLLLDSAAAVAKTIPNSTFLPMYHTVAGSYYVAVSEYSRAEDHFQKGMDIARQHAANELIATILFDQFKAYNAVGHYTKAKEKLLEELPYVAGETSLTNKQMTFYHLADITAKLGQYEESVKWYKEYVMVTDSLFVNKNKEQVLALEHKYRTSEKEKELLEIKAEHQKQSLALQKSRSLMIVTVSLCALLFIMGISRYRAQQIRKKLSEQKELLLKEELITHQQQAKLNLYNAMMEGEENERSRLARDLHDGLGGMLASLKMKLSAVTDQLKNSPIESKKNLESIIFQLDQSVSELRRVSRNLMPDTLLQRGLEDALRDLCRNLSQPSLKIDFQSSPLHHMYSNAFLVSVYRIVQELLANALKHSKASQVWVQCFEDERVLYITVEDNGVGFDRDEAFTQGRGMGLSNIQNRVSLLGGILDFDTKLDKGTSVHIQLNKI